MLALIPQNASSDDDYSCQAKPLYLRPESMSKGYLLLVCMRRLGTHGLPHGVQQLILCRRLAAQARHQLHCCQQGCQLSYSQCLQDGVLVCAGTSVPHIASKKSLCTGLLLVQIRQGLQVMRYI